MTFHPLDWVRKMAGERLGLIRPKSQIWRPMLWRETSFPPKMVQETAAVGQLLPHLGQERRALVAFTHNQPIDAGAEKMAQIVFGFRPDEGGFAQDRNL
jgi:hypothetical protein